jgi:hypothetical protein
VSYLSGFKIPNVIKNETAKLQKSVKSIPAKNQFG